MRSTCPGPKKEAVGPFPLTCDPHRSTARPSTLVPPHRSPAAAVPRVNALLKPVKVSELLGKVIGTTTGTSTRADITKGLCVPFVGGWGCVPARGPCPLLP
jgi:hypothetical protein